ncbi:hypothetical protein TNCV_643091 [Trichonephila clavipes]|nr:hypothetical protein TNCV_643091 [Trichonephila clavipes]
MTWATPELAPTLLITTPTGGRFRSRQILRASLPNTIVVLRQRSFEIRELILEPIGYKFLIYIWYKNNCNLTYLQLVMLKTRRVEEADSL